MDWMKYRKIYFSISGVLLAVSLITLITWGLNLGLDFTGGTILEYRFSEKISTEELSKELDDIEGVSVGSVQITSDGTYYVRLGSVSADIKVNIDEALLEYLGGEDAEGEAGELIEELRFETVGPSVGPELVKKTLYAITIAAIAILLWVAFQFKSIKFGVSAILAMLHDSFILLGALSILGHFFDAEVDFLFVTALLTTLSFSVHDTIVVFDRIRENQSNKGGKLYDLANQAITETMVRSLNNSFTIIFMLFALVLLGGTTIKWFAVALLIGTILGTYSSPFVGVPLLVTFDDLGKKLKMKRESTKVKKPKLSLAALRKQK